MLTANISAIILGLVRDLLFDTPHKKTIKSLPIRIKWLVLPANSKNDFKMIIGISLK